MLFIMCTISGVLEISIYSLNDLGFSSKLVGLHLGVIEHYSLPKESIMRDPNKRKWPA